LARQVAKGLNSAFVLNQKRKQNLHYLNLSKAAAEALKSQLKPAAEL